MSIRLIEHLKKAKIITEFVGKLVDICVMLPGLKSLSAAGLLQDQYESKTWF